LKGHNREKPEKMKRPQNQEKLKEKQLDIISEEVT
jgi:hypothetical protein